jgi:hypothetical protein
VKGPWPTPAQDAIEADAKALAAVWDAWGHRKLASLKRVGVDDITAGTVADSTMYRPLRRNGLCLPAVAMPAGYTGEVRQLAGVRRETFMTPPTRRNRLLQADFSEFETLGQGTWNLGGVVDYWAKVNLACTVSVTKTTRDAIAFFEAALTEVEVLLGVSWIEDLTDPDTGEVATLKLVTDHGSCFKSRGFAAWVAAKRHIVHIRTRKKVPWTNDDRTVLRGAEVRAALPPRHRRQHRARRPHRRLQDDLQLDPPARGHRHGPAARALPTDPEHQPSRPRICLRFLTRTARRWRGSETSCA